MFRNGEWIVYIALLNIIGGRVLQEIEGSPDIKGQPLMMGSDKQLCGCLNNGECYSPLIEQQSTINKKKQLYCHCPSSYIGEYCQIQAIELFNSKEITQRINTRQYKYFYYQPIEENMYSFSFDLCIEDKLPTKSNQDKQLYDQVTFFLTSQNQYGDFQVDESKTKAATIEIGPDQCKQITVDYTVLLITKLRTIQKLIFAVKFGDRLNINNTKIDKLQPQREKEHIKPAQKQIKKREPSQKQLNQNFNKPNDTSFSQTQNTQSSSSYDSLSSDYHPITFSIYTQKKKSSTEKQQDSNNNKKDNKNINDFKSKSPSKIKQSDNLYSSRSLSINFSAYPFMVEFVVFNILFSLTTLIAFVIVGVIIFVVRSRILGITLSTSFGMNSRLINDLKHFDRYLPQEKFIKKEKKEGDKSPSSSDLECAICLVKYQQMNLIRKLPCQHTFHKSCIDSWCYSNLTCPMCRRNLTEKNLMLYYNSTALELKNSPQSDQ